MTPSANIDILDNEPPENILNISRILPLCCSNKKLITAGSIPGRVIKLPSLKTINAKITKNIHTVELKYDYLDKIKETEITIYLLKKYNLVNNKTKKVKIIGPVTISSKKKLVDLVATKSVKEFIK